ncbi:MAG: response regulator [Candidatus Omnitrophica bacterium]|nr:response regulator [Candidatus Omnitrophota bacterium]
MKNKVLVIDDETAFLRIVKLNLEGTNKYEVLTLPSAEDILSQVRTFKPDIILLDIVVPGIKGPEACEMLNKDPDAAGIPIIILSALDRAADKLQAFKAGAVDYLVKPIGKEELIAKIEKALRDKNP